MSEIVQDMYLLKTTFNLPYAKLKNTAAFQIFLRVVKFHWRIRGQDHPKISDGPKALKSSAVLANCRIWIRSV